MTTNWPSFKTLAADFFKNNHVNQIITFLIIVAGLYVSLVSITGQHFLHPLAPVSSNTLDLRNAANEVLHSVISCFFMVSLAIAVGKIAKFFYIPSLVGCMAVGIAMRNIPQFGELFYINGYWQFILRKLALVIIIIRWGISINVRFINKNYIFPPILGVLSASCEAFAIFFTSWFFFGFPAPLAIICGFVVATVSPAVGMPTMLKMKEKGIGTDKNISDVIPAACCFDNIFSLCVFSLTASVTFTHDPFFPTLVKSIGAIVLAALIGCAIGWLIRWFPKNDTKHTHTARFLVLASSTYAVITSMIVMGYSFPGIIAGLALCCVSTTLWREDNPRGIKTLVHQYDNVWYFLAVPLLFSLVGYLLDFSQISGSDLKIALTLIAIGSSFRLISAMILSFCGHFNIYEQFIMALVLMPKATVQCALAPSLIFLADGFPELKKQTALIVNICVISAIVTSPVVEILLDLLAPRLLKIRTGAIYNMNKGFGYQDEVGIPVQIRKAQLKTDDPVMIYELNPNYVSNSNSPKSDNYARPSYHYANNNSRYQQ